MKELTILHVNNDYLAFQRRFHYLVAHHKKLMNDSENFYHDLFFIDLKEHQKSFIKTYLNDFYMTGQNSIKNIDIDNLMKQLMNHMNNDLKIHTADDRYDHVKEIENLILESDRGDISIHDALNGVIFTAICTAQSSIYKIVERMSEVDAHYESKVIYFTAKSHIYDNDYAKALTITGNNNPVNAQPQFQESSTAVKMLAEWHVDLRHIHTGVIIALAKNSLSDICIKSLKTNFFCNTCVKAGIMHKYLITSMPRAVRPMEQIHIDLVGDGYTLSNTDNHFIEFHQGIKYFILITNDMM
ncbi:hypothetical protein PAAG_12010 [Paracoccidioides lutzii Pb01]|uniref:Uncharacterized protein n=1 Tax=Paracoccidioides lutzii (strain ATCC MYA-826 / Pb01) TaxID=502779 RepID=A0A0A2VKB1_PARBA|nr:hypothetical protein PAAG_12010 [Paracoccidioides lutzii Pb01]KGQ01329.1 hypothetical protein PAAG_12010 [Paracoccidioides lutzii Pb01]